MNDRSLESEVREHYAAASLSEDRITAILDASQWAITASRWKRTAIAASVGLAAMTVLAIGLYLNRPPVQEPPITNRPDGGPAMEAIAESDSVNAESDDQRSESTYRLVAFRSHGDGCPHCRATGQVYNELATTLRDDPIAVEQIDLSLARPGSQVDQRIDELHLTALIQGRIETAFLALVDSNGTSLQEFKPSMTAERITERVRTALADRSKP